MRYRLRTLLILTTIVATYFGGRASLMPTIREQDNQRAALQKRIDTLEKETSEQRQRFNRIFLCPSSPPVPSKVSNS
jgi:hypothetical protein